MDDVLEDAIFAAGGIKLSNYRSRALSRLKWSRSSRTDKGVSSLATVVSLRMEVDPAAWDEDVEGAAIVESVNAHLPPNVRVFGAYSTPKSFQARRVCVQRTYDYLLPARVLGLAGAEWPGTDAAAGRSEEQILEAFREALRAFVGSHYFHNYTRRSYYSPSNEKAEWTKRGGKNRRGDDDLEPDNHDDDNHDDDAVATEAATDERAGDVGAKYVGSRENGWYWLLERDDDDLVGIKHNRKVNAFDAGEVETTPDGEPFVRVTVRGDSFMLYQIRKMIATACAATLGHFPLGTIAASLARPARVATRRAGVHAVPPGRGIHAVHAPWEKRHQGDRPERAAEDGTPGSLRARSRGRGEVSTRDARPVDGARAGERRVGHVRRKHVQTSGMATRRGGTRTHRRRAGGGGGARGVRGESGGDARETSGGGGNREARGFEGRNRVTRRRVDARLVDYSSGW